MTMLCLLGLLNLLAAMPAQAAPADFRVTEYRYRSQPGAVGDGATAVIADPTSISMSGDRSFIRAHVAADGGWDIELAAPAGERLQPGVYRHAERAVFRTGRSPGLDVSGQGAGCNQVFGRFSVNQIRTDVDGSVVALDVRFVQRCDSWDSPALRGWIRFEVAPLSYEFTSDAGDYIGAGAQERYEGATTLFTYYAIYNGGVRILVSGQRDEWWIWLAPPQGQTLSAGMYLDAQRAAFAEPGHPGLDIYGDGRGCNELGGWFDISAIRFATDGTLKRLAVTFEQHCENATPALHGQLRFYA